MKFDGYMAVYNDSDKNKMLPEMEEGETVKRYQLLQNSTSRNLRLATPKQL